MKEHPDKGGNPEKFRQLKEASEILSNPETR
jgi:curved DNA-binding protein CbpA